jgi:hypothetical protein
LLRRVALVRTDVSEEPGASFIRVTKVGELGTTQTATSNRRTLRRNTCALGTTQAATSNRRTLRRKPQISHLQLVQFHLSETQKCSKIQLNSPVALSNETIVLFRNFRITCAGCYAYYETSYSQPCRNQQFSCITVKVEITELRYGLHR